MIINNDDAIKRLNSPLNLINKLDKISKKKTEAMKIFMPSSSNGNGNNNKEAATSPVQNDELDQLLENSDSKIKLGLAHNTALNLLNSSIGILANKLDEVKADRLPSAILAASKVVESIRRERNELNKNDKGRDIHYHFYVPEQKKVEDFEVIDVG